MDLYRLVFKANDFESALFQIRKHPELWNQYNIRTTYKESAHKQASDIWLRYNDIKDGNAVYLRNELFSGKECIDYPAMKVLNNIHSMIHALMFLVEGERLGRIIVTKLYPGGEIDMHTDDGETAIYYDRFHIVLQEGGLFCVGPSATRMKNGEVWWFNNQKLHSVINDSDHERIHLIIDIKLMECSPFWGFKPHSYTRRLT